jgi:thiol-disulfide isomerase/thioredoxin
MDMPDLLLLTSALIAVGAIVALTMQGWVLVQVRSQQGRLGGRIEDLSGRLISRAEEEVKWERHKQINPLAGEVAPRFDVAALGGGRVTLDVLLAPAKPALLVFLSPQCGPCYELLPDIAGWQRVYGDRLTIALISSGTPDNNVAMTSELNIFPVLIQAESEVMEAFGLTQQPAAVLIGSNGRVTSGPRYGANAVRRLVAEALGLAMPDASQREIKAVVVGEAPPPMRRPDLKGNIVNFAAFRGLPTLVLFWSPGCSHCQGLIPEVQALEQTPGRPRMIIVSRGPAALNEAAGFISPMVLDDDHSIARTFGASGTPAAILLDGRGTVATQVARGADGVRSGLRALQALTAPATAAD